MDENILESVADVMRKTGSIHRRGAENTETTQRGEMEKISPSPSSPSAPPQRPPRLSGEVRVPVDFLCIKSNHQILIA